MRYVTLGANNGTYRLYQVLLFALLGGLRLGCGRVVHMDQGRRGDLAVRLRDLRLSQKDEAPVARPSSAPPVLRKLGFFPRDRDVPTRTPAEASSDLGQQGKRNESLDEKLWDALVDKALHNNVTSHFDGRLGAEPPRDDHLPVPHLKRLGFGVTNERKSGTFTGDAAHVLPHSSSQERNESLKKLVVVGFGSFVGGITVIGVMLLLVFLRCRHLFGRPAGSHDVEAKPDGPKPCTDSLDVPPPGGALESSTSSYSSGSAETSSSSSDTVSHTGSEAGDLWVAPGQIALSSLPPRTRRHRVTFADELEATADFEVDVLDYHSNEMCEQPDLLLDITPSVCLTPNRPRIDNNQTYSVSEGGGIVAVPNSDVVLVVPPGAVTHNRIEVFAKVHSALAFPSVKLNTKETVISSVTELVASGLGYLAKPATLTFPYRSLPTASHCSCENDPLCTCTGSRMELRACDTSTSATVTWSAIPVECHTPKSRYEWPECFSPDGGSDLDLLAPGTTMPQYQDRDAAVICTCSDGVARIRTRVPGLYCLVHVAPSGDHSGSWTGQSWSSGGSEPRLWAPPRVRLCVGVAARYHWQRGEGYGGPDRTLEEVQYTVCLGDNTTDIRQKMSDAMNASDSHKECEFLPLDVTVGSDVTVTLRSVFDSDWSWELPYDSPKKTISWSQICGDFGSLATMEFRCLPKDDEVFASDSEQCGIVTIFDVCMSERVPGRSSPETSTMVANSTF